MKTKLYLLTILLITGLFAQNVFADACYIRNTSIQVTNRTINGNSVTFTFSLSYDADFTVGSKFTILNLWSSSHYPSGTGACTYGTSTVPTSCLNTIDAIIILDNDRARDVPVNNSLVFLSTYDPYPAINSKVLDATDGLTFSSISNPATNYIRYTISGITMTLPIGDGLMAEVWGTNKPQMQGVHCGPQTFTLLAGNPTLSANFDCGGAIQMPATSHNATYSFTLSNSASDYTVTANVNVYKDMDGSNNFSAGDETQVIHTINDVVLYPVGSSVGSNNYSSGTLTYTMTDLPADASRRLLVVLSNIRITLVSSNQTTVSDNFIEAVVGQNCVLPVSLQNFYGSRINDNEVKLNWTANENSDRDVYNLQFSTDGNNWKDIASINAVKNNGEQASYNYIDKNNAAGYSLYRLKIVDASSKYVLSNVVKIQGVGKPFTYTISPNPSTDGNINIRLSTMNSKIDIVVCDMAGRTLKKINSALSGNYKLENIPNGTYFIRFNEVNGKNGMTEKVVVYR